MFPILYGILSKGFAYLLRDEFITLEATPLASPRICEPGPGTLTRTGNYGNGKSSINGGKLTFASDISAEGWYWSMTPTPGLAIRVDYNFISGSFGDIGICGNTTNLGVNRFSFLNDRTQVRDNDSPITIPNSNTIATELIFIVGANRHKYIQRISGSLVIAWISQNNLPVTPVGFIFSNTTQVCEYDNLSVIQLSSPWSSDYGVANVHVTPGVNDTDYTGTPDGIYDLITTAPAILAGSSGLIFRKQDANNFWIAYFDNSGAFKVDKYVAGSPDGSSPYVNVAGVIVGGGTRTIRIISDGSALRFYTLSGSTWTQRGGIITDSSYSAQSTLRPQATASWISGGGSIGQLDSFPRYIAGTALSILNSI